MLLLLFFYPQEIENEPSQTGSTSYCMNFFILVLLFDIHTGSYFFTWPYYIKKLGKVCQFLQKVHLIEIFLKLAQLQFIVFLKPPQLTRPALAPATSESPGQNYSCYVQKNDPVCTYFVRFLPKRFQSHLFLEERHLYMGVFLDPEPQSLGSYNMTF